MLVVNALEVRHVRHHQPQQVVMLPGHEIALHDLRHLAHRALEGLESRLALAIQGDAHEHIHREARLVLIDQRGVALDESAFLERAHAPQAGRFGQTHLPREQCVGDAGVLLQQAQNGAIVAVELHGRKIPSRNGWQTADSATVGRAWTPI